MPPHLLSSKKYCTPYIHIGKMHKTQPRGGEDARIEIFIDNMDHPTFESPSGLAFGPDGKFYVNSREGMQTISYDVVVNVNGTRSAQNAEVFTEHKDQPLGLLWVPIQ